MGARRGEEKERSKKRKKEKQRGGGNHRQNKSTQQVTDGKCSQNPTVKKIVIFAYSGPPPTPTAFHSSLVHSGSPPSPPPSPRHSSKPLPKGVQETLAPLPSHTCPHENPREPTSWPLRPSAFGSGPTLTAPQPLRGLVSTPHLSPLQPAGSTAPPSALARSLFQPYRNVTFISTGLQSQGRREKRKRAQRLVKSTGSKCNSPWEKLGDLIGVSSFLGSGCGFLPLPSAYGSSKFSV